MPLFGQILQYQIYSFQIIQSQNAWEKSPKNKIIQDGLHKEMSTVNIFHSLLKTLIKKLFKLF